MKGIILLALSVIILSQGYGLAYAVHVTGHLGTDIDSSGNIIEDSILNVLTDSLSYESGETINISGSISHYDESDPYKNFDVTLRLLDPKNNIISISQISPNSDGSYSTSVLADGPLWKFDGDYIISVSHGSDKNASTTFAFTLSEIEVVEVEVEAEIEISEEELAKGCGEGTHLEDGVCVLDETAETVSTSSTTGSSPSTGFNSWIYSISFTILIAFAIMIILYLISRASRNKE